MAHRRGGLIALNAYNRYSSDLAIRDSPLPFGRAERTYDIGLIGDNRTELPLPVRGPSF